MQQKEVGKLGARGEAVKIQEPTAAVIRTV